MLIHLSATHIIFGKTKKKIVHNAFDRINKIETWAYLENVLLLYYLKKKTPQGGERGEP